MEQNVCRMECFLAKKAHVWQQYLQKVLAMSGMGTLSVTPYIEKI